MLGIDIMKRLGGGGAAGGEAAGTVNLIDAAVAGQLYAQWIINNNGYTYKRATGGAPVIDNSWINPQTGTSQFEVRATVASGDTPDGTLNSWINLGTSSPPFSDPRTWGWEGPSNEKTCNLTIEIRRVSDSVVVDTATVNLWCAGTGEQL